MTISPPSSTQSMSKAAEPLSALQLQRQREDAARFKAYMETPEGQAAAAAKEQRQEENLARMEAVMRMSEMSDEADGTDPRGHKKQAKLFAKHAPKKPIGGLLGIFAKMKKG